jgi:ribosomal protein S1
MSFPAEDSEYSQSMDELLESVDAIKPIRRGDVVEGVVMRADSDGIFVNTGHKSEGVVPPGEMRTLDLDTLSVGDSVITLVVRSETGEDAAILSVDRAVGEQGWRYLEKIMEADSTIDGEIMGFNRGGAIVEVEGVQGFVPMSQLVSVSRAHFRDRQPRPAPPAQEAPRAPAVQPESAAAVVTEKPAEGESAPAGATEAKPEQPAPAESSGEAAPQQPTPEPAAPAESSGEAAPQQPTPEPAAPAESSGEAAPQQPTPEPAAPEEDPRAADIGRVLTLKVLEVNRSRNRAIFSERQALQEIRDRQKARLIEELTLGEIRRGKVTGISSFGAFVDLGGADGLIHISELSWDSVEKPEDVVQLGQELDVYVLRVDAEDKKIALSLRRLQPEPWETIHERYRVGDIVDATVTKLTNFGAFARLEGSVEGLIHISELSTGMIGHPREAVREGEELRLKILRIEPDRRRLGLSLKEAQAEENF